MKLWHWQKALKVDAVYANRDYEPVAKQRDNKVASKMPGG